MDIKQKYREETNLDVYPKGILGVGASFSNEYVKWLEEQLRIANVVKSLPVDRETALKVREDIINEHYKDDPNKSTFGLAFITCYDWLAKLCTK